MGFLDDLLGNLLGKQGDSVSHQQGAGHVFQSWISTGKNLPVSAEQIMHALGNQQVDQLSRKAGLSASQGLSALVQLLPLVIDRLTPDGKVPQQNQLADAGMNLLKRLLA